MKDESLKRRIVVLEPDSFNGTPGYVELIDWIGDDQRVVDSARVSYQGKRASSDPSLISYLLENRHTSPFEQVQFTFEMKLPIFVARQVVRHRTAKLNEESARYSILAEEFYVPVLSRLRTQDKVNRQGSSDEQVSDPETCQRCIVDTSLASFAAYRNLLESGLSRELARTVLPLNAYTSWRWTMDLNNLFHFLSLRMDAHAQWEVQQYAEAIYELIQPIVPISLAAWEEHARKAVRFSATETELLRKLFTTYAPDVRRNLLEEYAEGPLRSNSDRRIRQFCRKIGTDYPDHNPKSE